MRGNALEKLHFAGVGIDLDFDDAGGVRVDLIRNAGHVGRVQIGGLRVVVARADGQTAVLAHRAHELGIGHLFGLIRGAVDLAVAEDQLFLRDVQKLGSGALELAHGLRAGVLHGVAGDECLAGCGRRAALGSDHGVRPGDVDVFKLKTERFGGNRRGDARDALADVGRADGDVNAGIGQDFYESGGRVRKTGVADAVEHAADACSSQFHICGLQSGSRRSRASGMTSSAFLIASASVS